MLQLDTFLSICEWIPVIQWSWKTWFSLNLQFNNCSSCLTEQCPKTSVGDDVISGVHITHLRLTKGIGDLINRQSNQDLESYIEILLSNWLIIPNKLREYMRYYFPTGLFSNIWDNQQFPITYPQPICKDFNFRLQKNHRFLQAWLVVPSQCMMSWFFLCCGWMTWKPSSLPGGL